MPRAIKIVEIDGVKYVPYNDLFNELLPGKILKSVNTSSDFEYNDIILLVKNVQISYDKWECALIYSDHSKYPATIDVRADEIESTEGFVSISYEEYLDYVRT